MTFPQIYIEDVCALVTDGTHYTPPDIGQGVPFLTVKDMTKSGLDLVNSSKISREEFEKADDGNSAPKVGDVLFSKDGTVGKVRVVVDGTDFAVLSSVAILRPNKELIDSEYLGRVLETKHVLDQAVRKKTGSAIRRIILSDLKRVMIPLPPLEEQKRIAAILDKADTIRHKRQQAIELADQFLRSVFLDMFGDPVTNPKGWEIAPLSKLVDSLEGGKNVKPEGLAVQTERRILKVSAVTSGCFKEKESKPLPDEFDPPESFYVQKGDLLISRANTAELIGATALVDHQPKNLILPDKIWRFVWKDSSKLSPAFIHYLFKQKHIRREISIRSSGTSGSMKNIPKPKLLEIPIPIPPSSKQNDFQLVFEAISKLKRKLGDVLKENNHFFDSISQKAFKGELTQSKET